MATAEYEADFTSLLDKGRLNQAGESKIYPRTLSLLHLQSLYLGAKTDTSLEYIYVVGKKLHSHLSRHMSSSQVASALNNEMESLTSKLCDWRMEIQEARPWKVRDTGVGGCELKRNISCFLWSDKSRMAGQVGWALLLAKSGKSQEKQQSCVHLHHRIPCLTPLC